MPQDRSDNDARGIARYHRVEFRAIVVVLVLIGLTVGMCGWMMVRMIEERLNQAVARDAFLLGNRLAEGMGPAIASQDVQALSESLLRADDDLQLAFAVVESTDGRILSRRVNSPACWARYTERWPTGDPGFVLSRPTPLGVMGLPEVHVYRTPVFLRRGSGDSGRLMGYVTLALTDPIHRSTIQALRATGLGVVCIACLFSIPATIVCVRRLIRPLRRIADATAVIAAGGVPPALAVARRDEIGVLARSFDDMVQKLAVAKRRLLEANAELERQVRQRTVELQRVNALLRRQIETKNEFIRAVSHDLGAPLRNIGGLIGRLRRRESDLPADVVETLDRMASMVELEMTMLEDLLHLSRLRTRPCEIQDVDLAALVRQILDALSNDLAERDIACHVTTQLPVVQVEFSLARQVFLNLIDNAIKYMGNRPVRRIEIGHVVEDGLLKIRVADTGPGIPEAERERIFEVFRRGSATVDGRVPGRGIGLTSVRLVVERWGGTVQVDSRVGEGSVFTVVLPAERASRPAVRADESPAAAGAQAA